jgi:hypothetical protein
MNNVMANNSLLNKLVFVGALLIIATRLFSDFWNDEIYSIINFVCVPLKKTVTDYHVPNNHVFSNLAQSIYLKCLGVHDYSTVLKHPILLRLLALAQCGILFYVCMAIGKLQQKPLFGALLILILITTPAYYYLALEQRAYGLSITIMSIVALQILKFLKHHKPRQLLFILLSTALLLYAIPSNLIFLIALCISLFLLVNFYVYFKHNLRYAAALLKVLVALVAGIGLSALLYLPILQHVLNNPYVNKDDGVTQQHTGEIINFIWQGTVLHHIIVLVFGAVASLLITKKISKFTVYTLLLTAITFATCYCLMLYLQLPAPQRIFSFVIIVVAFFIASLLSDALQSVKQTKLAFVCIAFLCIANLYNSVQKTKAHIYTKLKQNERPQDFGVNYYQHFYEPTKAMQLIKQKLANKKVYLFGAEPHDAPHFLDAHNITYTTINNEQDLLDIQDSFVLLTSYPSKFLGKWGFELESEELGYFTVFMGGATVR